MSSLPLNFGSTVTSIVSVHEIKCYLVTCNDLLNNIILKFHSSQMSSVIYIILILPEVVS